MGQVCHLQVWGKVFFNKKAFFFKKDPKKRYGRLWNYFSWELNENIHHSVCWRNQNIMWNSQNISNVDWHNIEDIICNWKSSHMRATLCTINWGFWHVSSRGKNGNHRWMKTALTRHKKSFPRELWDQYFNVLF